MLKYATFTTGHFDERRARGAEGLVQGTPISWFKNSPEMPHLIWPTPDTFARYFSQIHTTTATSREPISYEECCKRESNEDIGLMVDEDA